MTTSTSDKMLARGPFAEECQRCKQPASRICSGCKDTRNVDNPFGPKINTRYCSSECQTIDWESHKASCKKMKSVRSLYRAGEVLQDIFYKYRKALYDKGISKVEKKDGKLYLWEEDYSMENGHRAVDSLYEFPEHLFENEEDKQSALVQQACNDALICMTGLVHYFLDGLASRITESTIRTKNPRRSTIAVEVNGGLEKDGSALVHSVFCIKLKGSNELYVLDLSGAQQGYYDPVTPLREYQRTRIRVTIVDIGRLMSNPGTRREKTVQAIIKASRIQSGEYAVAMSLLSLNLKVSGLLVQLAPIYEESASSISDMLRLPLEEFQIQAKSFSNFIEAAVQDDVVEEKKA